MPEPLDDILIELISNDQALNMNSFIYFSTNEINATLEIVETQSNKVIIQFTYVGVLINDSAQSIVNPQVQVGCQAIKLDIHKISGWIGKYFYTIG